MVKKLDMKTLLSMAVLIANNNHNNFSSIYLKSVVTRDLKRGKLYSDAHSFRSELHHDLQAEPSEHYDPQDGPKPAHKGKQLRGG